MNDLQFISLSLGAIILLSVGGAIILLGCGALCLHLSTGLLGFKKRSFGKAFATNLLIVFCPALGSGAVHLLNSYVAKGFQPAWPFVVGSVIAGLLSALLPILILRHNYKQPFVKALLAYIVSGLLQVGLVVVIALLVLATIYFLGEFSTASPP
jgi:hypothetical protein